MSLTAAFQAARASMGIASAQTSLTSRNIAGAGDVSYAQKYAVVSTSPNGPAVVSIERAADLALRRSLLDANSASAAASASADGYQAIDAAFAGTGPETSIMGRLGALQDSLRTAATQPNNLAMTDAVLESAKDVVATLAAANEAIQNVRAQADAAIATSVTNINRLLSDFSVTESELLREKGRGGDVTAILDQRDSIIAALSNEIGVNVVQNSDGSTAIYATGGAVLFNREPRTVSFTATDQFTAGASGNDVYIDGVNVTAEHSPMRASGGRLSGSVEIRDQAAPLTQRQLDEIARGLVVAFSEADVSGASSAPALPGLFTYPGAAPVGAAVLMPGLAGVIRVNPSVDPAQGGSPLRIRDGGAADPGNAAYVANPSQAAGYSARLLSYVDAMRSAQDFDPGAQLGSSQGLLAFIEGAISFSASRNQRASEASQQTGVLKDRMTVALSNATGVNVDEEMARLLDVENAYRASAKLITTINGLYQTLFDSIR
ncbi:MAG: flagellar hook-associated protein FlgK [Beijerinckiaceae bacterium]